MIKEKCKCKEPIYQKLGNAVFCQKCNLFRDFQNYDESSVGSQEVEEEKEKWYLDKCDNCIQLTNHLNGVCLKCKGNPNLSTPFTSDGNKPPTQPTSLEESWIEEYPLNTFYGETKRELIRLILTLILKERASVRKEIVEKQIKLLKNYYYWIEIDEAIRQDIINLLTKEN